MTNVLLYVLDALRADHLSCYGYERPTSPNIDALAAEPEAVRFTRLYSPSTWTKPVAASILSGCYPPAHGVRTRNDLFIRNVPRLPELLQSAGYVTAAVSSIGNVSSPMGFAIGFDRFVDLYKEPALASRREVSNTGVWKLYFEQDTTVVLPLAEDVHQYALGWLKEISRSADQQISVFGSTKQQTNGSALGSQQSGAPWFLFLWVLDTHDPYYPPEGYDRWRDLTYTGRVDGSAESVRRVRTPADVQRLVDLYDGEIAYADDQFGRLLAQLKAMGAYDDTLIVVVGDHGEAFGEHGDFVHGHLAYEEVMHVPLVVKFPSGARVASKVNDVMAQLTDIAPTILDALGLGSLSAGMQGYSLLPAVQQGQAPRSAAYSETQASSANSRLLAVRDGRWKYLRIDPPADYAGLQAAGQATAAASEPQAYSRGRRLSHYVQQLSNPAMLKKVLANPMFYVRRQLAEPRMLFDLEADPEEKQNVVRRHPEIAQEMEAALDAWLAECRVYAELNERRASGIGLDEETMRQLQGLGYL